MRSYQLVERSTDEESDLPTFHATRTLLAYIVKSAQENTFSSRSYLWQWHHALASDPDDTCVHMATNYWFAEN